MPGQSFENRYRSYTDLLTTSTPTLTELDAIARQIGRLSTEVGRADLEEDQHRALEELRNHALGALAAAQHRARIDATAAVATAINTSGEQLVAAAGEDLVDDVPVPCEHWDDQIGYVAAGDPHSATHSAIVSCSDCVPAAQQYVSERTGLPAGPVQPFADDYPAG
ncbi:hypothetical protein AB0L62_33290 [Nocardia asteroides]|uniref:hypothetical protein n=1 Tax=Nocardia asteroides TaxID=1824 RepID=UPI003428F0CF